MIDQRPRLLPMAGRGGVVVEHQLDEFALHQERRIPGQGQHEIALVHRADVLEQPPPLFIHGRRHRVGEVRASRLGVMRGWAPHRIHMDHPAVAQAGQCLVDAVGHEVALLVRGAGVVVPAVAPRGHERSVLADDDTIVHHRRIHQQIRQAGIRLAVLLQFARMVHRMNAGIQHTQEQDACCGDQHES